MNRIKTELVLFDYTNAIGYISRFQPQEILTNLIKQQDHFQLIKPETGSGASHGVLTIKKGKVLMIAPTVALVKEKETQYINGMFPSQNISFYYGEKTDRLKNHTPQENDIIMTTIDQLVLSKRDFSDYSLIIDELHVMIMSMSYRDLIKDNLKKIVENFKTIITITATPLYKFPNYFKDFKTIRLYNKQEEKNIEYTNNFANVLKYINNTKKLIVFSNDRSFLSRIRRTVKKRTRYILGHTLMTKLKIEQKTVDEENPELILISSAGVEGIDIYESNFDILIHNKYRMDYSHYLTQNIIQALGRTRKGFGTALLYLDDEIINDYIPNIEKTITNINRDIDLKKIKSKEQINYIKEFKKYNYILRSLDKMNDEYVKFTNNVRTSMSEGIENIYLYDNEFQFNLENVKYSTMVTKKYLGFKIQILFIYLVVDVMKQLDKENIHILDIIKRFEGTSSEKVMRMIMGIFDELKLTKNSYNTHYLSLNNKYPRSYNQLFFESKKIKKSGKVLFKIKKMKTIKKIKIKDLDIEETFPDLNISIHDLDFLFNMAYPSKDKMKELEEETINHFLKRNSDVQKYMIVSFFKKLYKKTKNKKILSDIEVIKKYKNRGKKIVDTFTKEELFGFLQRYRYLKYSDKLTEHIKKELIKRNKKQLREIGIMYVNRFTYGVKRDITREFSSLANTSLNLVGLFSPFKVIDYDFKGAYPSMTNVLVGFDDKGVEIYQRLIDNGITKTRTESKILFNKLLNSTTKQMKKAEKINILKNCGYNMLQINKIIDFNKNKGDAYILFTSIEDSLIKPLKQKLKYLISENVYSRRHDSIVIFSRTEKIIKNNFEISKNIKTKYGSFNFNMVISLEEF